MSSRGYVTTSNQSKRQRSHKPRLEAQATTPRLCTQLLALALVLLVQGPEQMLAARRKQIVWRRSWGRVCVLYKLSSIACWLI